MIDLKVVVFEIAISENKIIIRRNSSIYKRYESVK